jgi:hypothetical protein
MDESPATDGIRLLSLNVRGRTVQGVYNVGMRITTRTAVGLATSLMLAALLAATPLAQKNDAQKADKNGDKPKLTLTARPTVAIAPARVVLTAELTGGADDYQEYYCPSVRWEWGDLSSSESSMDCPPYEEGKTEIKRRFTVEHVFRAGAYRVMFRLKRHDKAVGFATVNIQVRPGLRDISQ